MLTSQPEQAARINVGRLPPRRAVLYAGVLALVLVCPPIEARSLPPPMIEATVLYVVDGDTLRVDTRDCQGCYVRLLEIDAPEKDQPYGRQAKQALIALVGGEGSTVYLRIQGKDRYGRLLGYVYTDPNGAGAIVNFRLVALGAAWVYDDYASSDTLFVLEATAEANGMGLWGLPPAQRRPPWEWRHRSR